jgi:hypothetical protein
VEELVLWFKERFWYLEVRHARIGKVGVEPWQGLKAATEDERKELIKEKQISTSIENLCGPLPKDFVKYFKCVRDLDFDDHLNHSYPRKLLRDQRYSLGKVWSMIHVFDKTLTMTAFSIQRLAFELERVIPP